MITIKEQENKISIKYLQPSDWKALLVLLLLIYPVMTIYQASVFNIKPVITIIVLAALYIFLLFRRKREILEFDFKNCLITYKTRTIQKLEMERDIQIFISTQFKGAPYSPAYSFCFSLAISSKSFPLFDGLNYRQAFKLANLFYRLDQQNLLSLGRRGNFMAENPARYSLFLIPAVICFFLLALLYFTKDNLALYLGISGSSSFIFSGAAFLLIPLAYILYRYYQSNQGKGQYLITEEEAGYKMSGLPEEKI
ncbi:MAG: hypothetical protein WBP45_12050 [Daejeonella sp.]